MKKLENTPLSNFRTIKPPMYVRKSYSSRKNASN